MTGRDLLNCASGTSGSRIKTAVLMGGIGTERSVSMESGRCVADAIAKAGLEVITADVRPDRLEVLDRGDIDVFFVALHGEFGEDGRLQEILEGRSLVYTGSGPAASRTAFDKLLSKRAFVQAGINVPAAVEFKPDTTAEVLAEQLKSQTGNYVIKPLRQGSSVGVSIVSGLLEAHRTARQVLSEFGNCMVEQYVPGTEITVGILGGRALPIIEIRSKRQFYDYHAKYNDEATQLLFDTIEQSEVVRSIEEAALACFDSLGCRDFARVDLMLGEDHKPYALEVNTIPGFTTHSCLPRAAAKAGLSMSELCVSIIKAAMSRNKTAAR